MGSNGEKDRMNMKILIVEDDLSTRKLERMMLQRSGYCVREAENCLVASRVLDVEHIDLILLDRLLLEMTGMEFLNKIKSNPITATIPVILCTSESKLDCVQEAISLGINEYILKPINAKDLAQKVQQVLKKIEPVLEHPKKTTKNLGLNSEEYRQLLTLLVNDGKQRLKSIGMKVEAGDFKDFCLFVHDLSSSADNLGAIALHQLPWKPLHLFQMLTKKCSKSIFVKSGAKLNASVWQSRA